MFTELAYFVILVALSGSNPTELQANTSLEGVEAGEGARCVFSGIALDFVSSHDRESELPSEYLSCAARGIEAPQVVAGESEAENGGEGERSPGEDKSEIVETPAPEEDECSRADAASRTLDRLSEAWQKIIDWVGEALDRLREKAEEARQRADSKSKDPV